MTGRSSAGMGVICATFYVWHRRECDPQGNFKHPTEDKTYRRLSLLTNEVELIRNSKNTVRAQAFWLMNSERLDAATEHLEAALLGFQLPSR